MFSSTCWPWMAAVSAGFLIGCLTPIHAQVQAVDDIIADSGGTSSSTSYELEDAVSIDEDESPASSATYSIVSAEDDAASNSSITDWSLLE